MARPVLMVIIINMVTISIRPYSLRKVSLLGLTLFCLSCLSAFAQPLYVNVGSTPYDRQMARIRPVLVAINPELARNHDGIVNNLRNQIVQRAASIERQLNVPEPIPLPFALSDPG